VTTTHSTASARRARYRKVVLIGITSLLSACSAVQLPQMERQPAERYALSQAKEGLVIGLQPLTDPDDVERYFGGNLLDTNIFPVLVVAENHSPESSFVLSRDRVGVKGALTTIPSNDQIASPRAGEIVSTIGVALVIVPILSPPFTLTGLHMVSNAYAKQLNFVKNRLYGHTLPPGGQVSGFAFLEFPGPLPPQVVLTLDALDLQTRQPVDFAFPVSLHRS
jgi:hypothetical protein